MFSLFGMTGKCEMDIDGVQVELEKVLGVAVDLPVCQWMWKYNHDRPNMVLGLHHP